MLNAFVYFFYSLITGGDNLLERFGKRDENEEDAKHLLKTMRRENMRLRAENVELRNHARTQASQSAPAGRTAGAAYGLPGK